MRTNENGLIEENKWKILKAIGVNSGEKYEGVIISEDGAKFLIVPEHLSGTYTDDDIRSLYKDTLKVISIR